MSSEKQIDNRIKTTVVTNAEQQRDAFLVRAVSFAEEGKIPLRVIADGNDFQATHFVAYIDDEPIGSARVRWFRDFAKFERTCFVAAHRNARSIYTTSRVIFSHIAQKGYDRVITYASPKFAVLWVRLLGFEINRRKAPLMLGLSDEPYVELVKHLENGGPQINDQSDGLLLERIEGHWDLPMQYEIPR